MKSKIQWVSLLGLVLVSAAQAEMTADCRGSNGLGPDLVHEDGGAIRIDFREKGPRIKGSPIEILNLRNQLEEVIVRFESPTSTSLEYRFENLKKCQMESQARLRIYQVSPTSRVFEREIVCQCASS